MDSLNGVKIFDNQIWYSNLKKIMTGKNSVREPVLPVNEPVEPVLRPVASQNGRGPCLGNGTQVDDGKFFHTLCMDTVYFIKFF